MSALEVILIVFGAMFGLPVVAYLVMKFGTAGFFRARDRHDLSLGNNNKQKRKDDEK